MVMLQGSRGAGPSWLRKMLVRSFVRACRLKRPFWVIPNIPVAVSEPLVLSWSHFVGIHRKKLTKSSRIDFPLTLVRTPLGNNRRFQETSGVSINNRSQKKTKRRVPATCAGEWTVSVLLLKHPDTLGAPCVWPEASNRGSDSGSSHGSVTSRHPQRSEIFERIYYKFCCRIWDRRICQIKGTHAS